MPFFNTRSGLSTSLAFGLQVTKLSRRFHLPDILAGLKRMEPGYPFGSPLQKCPKPAENWSNAHVKGPACVVNVAPLACHVQHFASANALSLKL